MLLPISSSLAGCSWLFVQPLAPRGRYTDCTTDRTAPVVDTILTLTNLGSAVYVAGQDNVSNKGVAVTSGLLVGAMWFSSALYGYDKTSECKAAMEDDEPAGYSRRPPIRLRSSTPAVGGPAGVPSGPPPAWDTPSVTVSPPAPARRAPVPAARASQPRVDDSPAAPAPPAPAAPQRTDAE
jgi:hypothetical protein